MKIAMIIPDRSSEKAISSYSMEIVKSIRNQDVNIDTVFYNAGKPFSLLKNILKIREYDVVHIQHEYNLLGFFGIPFFIVYFLLGIFKSNIVVTMMHTVLSQKEKFQGNRIKNFLRKRFYIVQNKFINWFSDTIIVSMSFHKKILEKEYGIKPEKIKIFYSGGPTNVKITSKSKAKKELNLSGPVYLIIGNLVPDHGAEIFIRQADRIGKTILIVSNPTPINDRNQKRLTNYLEKLKQIVKSKKLDKYVRFDIIPINDNMPLWWKYFSAADIVLQAYRKGIGSGIFLHAMASKTPVVSSNNEFFNEIEKSFNCLRIAKKDDDYPIEIKNAMIQKNYKKMEKECARYLKENSWNKIGEEYKNLYCSLTRFKNPKLR